MAFLLRSILFLAPLVLTAPTLRQLGDITILAADNLITNDTQTTSAALLLSTPYTLTGAAHACNLLSEDLWSPKLENFDAGLNSSLSYEVYDGNVAEDQLFWIAGGVPAWTKHHHRPSCQAIGVDGCVHDVSCYDKLPVLCTQSAPASNITYADTAAPFQIAQKVGQQTLVGYRDFLTFRFMGVRFAQEPERFTYSSVYDATGTNDALDPAPECLQAPNNGSTDCLFLNVWTTHLPAAAVPAKKDLKPVMVYIYGGGFATGSASNPTNDGGNLAARGDVVVVDIAYRLGTLGFLALNDGVHNGNYWLSDCIAGLEWVRDNIAALGGDPDAVTIFGESAGAESVQALLASPKATGLFRGALMQSNYFQPYVPLADAMNTTTTQILNVTGCAGAADQLACLQAVNATELVSAKVIFNYPIIDGTYLTSSYLNINGSTNATVNSVPILISINRDEEGVLAPLINTTNLTTAIVDVAGAGASAVLASGAFPLGSSLTNNLTLDVFNTTTRLLTDASFHCSNEFTAYAGVKTGVLPNVWYSEFNRTYQDPGYNSNGVCGAPITASHPFGDPELEYYKCHAGDLANTFGNVARVGFPARDEYDMPFAALVVDYWTAFGRTLNPNPDAGYLKARGYWSTIGQIAESGPWEAVTVNDPKQLVLQWNSVMMPLPDQEQCAVLGQPLDYLL